jgi:3-mercaptopyruvate sulfurtransferase SseA
MQGLEADSPIIIYCEGIGCELSFFLGRDLKAGGFSNIKIFYGGYPEWSSAGLPVDKSS